MSFRPFTARGVVLLATGILFFVIATLLAAPILLYIAVLLLVLPVLAVIVVYLSRKRVSVSRRVSPGLLTVGSDAHVTVSVDLSDTARPGGRWHDVVGEGLTAEARGTLHSAVLRYDLTATRRGDWALGPWRLRTQDPFGLAQRARLAPETTRVIVGPEIIPLVSFDAHVMGTGGATRASSNMLGQGSDNLSPRPYAHGDSMRRIHWRATAHRGALMVRQEEEEPSPEALLILDRAAARWADDPEGFEVAVSACASLALHLHDDGFRVEVIDSAGSSLGVLRGQEGEREDLLTVLATVAPEGERRPMPALLGGASRGTVALITGVIDEAERYGTARHPLLFGTPASAEVADHLRTLGWTWASLQHGIAAAWDTVHSRAGAAS